jgi:hypothetical protein
LFHIVTEDSSNVWRLIGADIEDKTVAKRKLTLALSNEITANTAKT